MRRANLIITGRVQGVYFRESARQEASRLGVVGWVRNLRSGEVEALAEGPPDAVEAFVAWCRQGPLTARVDGLAVKDGVPTGEFSTFFVER